jgi:hypothetical protein
MKKIIITIGIFLGFVFTVLSIYPFNSNASTVVFKRGVLFGYDISALQNQKWATVDDASTTSKYIAEESTWVRVGNFNGTATTSPVDYLPYSPLNSAVDKINLMSGIVYKDLRTGLWWTDWAATGNPTAVGTSTTNNFTASIDGVRPTGGNAIGFCNALNAISFAGYADWYLPTQKQLMQAYIDGSNHNLPNPTHTFWSSTENYNAATVAWSVHLTYGYTTNPNKTTSYYVRCVRP